MQVSKMYSREVELNNKEDIYDDIEKSFDTIHKIAQEIKKKTKVVTIEDETLDNIVPDVTTIEKELERIVLVEQEKKEQAPSDENHSSNHVDQGVS